MCVVIAVKSWNSKYVIHRLGITWVHIAVSQILERPHTEQGKTQRNGSGSSWQGTSQEPDHNIVGIGVNTMENVKKVKVKSFASKIESRNYKI